MSTTDFQTLTAALAAVEAAWNKQPDVEACFCVDDLLAALRAVRESGAVVAVVSREAVVALREAHGEHSKPFASFSAHYLDRELYRLLARDLADILKETP